MKFLSVAQHGSTKGLGTDTASIQHLNLMEQAIGDMEDLYLSTWDMKRAFDALSKSLIMIGWERGGVPTEVARWIAEMDVEGVTVVRSPAAEKTGKC